MGKSSCHFCVTTFGHWQPAGRLPWKRYHLKSNVLSVVCSAGAESAQCWSNYEDIPHRQGQRSPSKTVGARAAGRALVRLWGDNPCPKAKETLKQDVRRCEIALRIKPHTCQSCSEGSNIACAHQDPGERSSDPTVDWSRFASENPGVSSRGMSRGGLLQWAVSAAVQAWDVLKEDSIIFNASIIVWSQINNREGRQPHPWTENCITDLWSISLPSEQDPLSPSVSLSHQEVSIGLLSFFTKGQTDWKPQSQKTEQSDHMDHSLVLTQGNSAILCRATQDGWVMVESSDQTWSTDEGNGKPLQYSCIKNRMNSMKGKKLGHWKMKSPGQ